MYDQLDGLNQNSFKWNSGTTPTYANWAPNEPRPNGYCVSLYVNDFTSQYTVGQWAVNSCNYKNSYICKKPVERSTQTTPTTDPGCPEVDFTLFI
jgi:hypothetical protein